MSIDPEHAFEIAVRARSVASGIGRRARAAPDQRPAARADTSPPAQTFHRLRLRLEGTPDPDAERTARLARVRDRLNRRQDEVSDAVLATSMLRDGDLARVLGLVPPW